MAVTKAVILARGLGTRMRRVDEAARLNEAQAAAADVGLKAMIPVGNGRPFIDYVLSALADAGITDACLVIGPEHTAVRAHYGETARPERLRVHFAIQAEPIGTANAVLAAEAFVAGDAFLVLNSDNFYPAPVLAELLRQTAPALPAFEPLALSELGNIPPERIAKYALLEIAPDGRLEHIWEKPDAATIARLGRDAPVSMNVWLLTPRILQACREVPLSPRGEYELPVAMEKAVREGVPVRTFPVRAAVLDLSQRADIGTVWQYLERLPARP
ncbi:MAG: nucleotidyltransferase family protein [Gemmatimonadetes bacterium]|nr:nucleotidyltransferase family protein [Gemmatimonadota bacterium]